MGDPEVVAEEIPDYDDDKFEGEEDNVGNEAPEEEEVEDIQPDDNRNPFWDE